MGILKTASFVMVSAVAGTFASDFLSKNLTPRLPIENAVALKGLSLGYTAFAAIGTFGILSAMF